MPFCSQCGTSLGHRDFFFGKCGARQPIPGTPGIYRAAGEGMTPRTASMLCYIPFVGWLAAIFVLASHRFRDSRDVRFHAFQGLYLFVAWLMLSWTSAFPFFHFGPMPFFPLHKLLELFVFGVSIFMLIKASREERFSLPVLGELAERSL